jgi:hypothetical protein
MVGSEDGSVKERRRHETPQGGLEDEFARRKHSRLGAQTQSLVTRDETVPARITEGNRVRILEAVIGVFSRRGFDGAGVAEIAKRKIIASEVKPPRGEISSRRRGSPQYSLAIPRAPASRDIGLLMPGDDPRRNLAIYVPGHWVGAMIELTLRRLRDSFERK